MKNQEYNSFVENNHIDEMKNFEAIQYNRINTETFNNNTEIYDVSEIKNYTEKNNKKNKNSENAAKKILQKITESTSSLIGTVTATATVAVVSVVMFANVIISQLNVQLLSFNQGYDYVEYSLYLDELNENETYYATVSNSFEYYQYELFAGENSNRIDNLTPNSVYELTVIGINNENGDISKYFVNKFYTIDEEIINQYTIRWMNGNEVLYEEQLDEGIIPSYKGEIPTKETTLEYTYTFIGWDKQIEEVTQDTIYYAVFEETSNIYNATYDMINGSQLIIHWDNEDYNIIEFNTSFDNSLDSRLQYRITLTALGYGESFVYQGIDQVATIKVPKDASVFNIKYESIGIYAGEEKIFEETLLENELIINNPEIIMSEKLELTNVDQYSLDFNINTTSKEEIYNIITLDLTYSDNSTKTIVINDVKINNESNKLTLDVPSGIDNILVDYTIELLAQNGNNKRVIIGSNTYELENELKLESVYADSYLYNIAKFSFIYHFIDNENIIVVENKTDGESANLSNGEKNAEIYIDPSIEYNEFEYYVSSSTGVELTQRTQLNIETTVPTGEYHMNYTNPGDAVLTYNDDGTMNIYLNTSFETTDPDIYYSISYTNHETNEVHVINYRDAVAKLEDIEFNNYGIAFSVYKEKDGINYLMYELVPSGAIEPKIDYPISGSINDLGENSEVNISMYSYEFDNSSFVLIVDGNEYNLNPEDIVFDELSHTYNINYQLDFVPSQVTLSFLGTRYYEFYDVISSLTTIKGNKYKEINVEIL